MASPLLDVKKFKHVKSDAHTTTLQHEDGHTLTLAHKNLSKPNQEQLKALAKMADNSKTAAQRTDDPGDRPGRNADVDRQDRPDKGYGKIIYKAEGGEVDEQPKAEVPDYLKPNSDYQAPAQAPMPAININVGGGQPQAQVAPPQPSNQLNDQDRAALSSLTKDNSGYLNRIPELNRTGPAPDQSVVSQPQATPTTKSLPSWVERSMNSSPGIDTRQQPVEDVQSQQAPMPEQAAPKAVARPQAVQPQAPMPAPAKTFEEHKAEVSHELNTESTAFQKDLDDGHIEPKTIHDMFANKSVPGKLATVFGMILAGAGSGLTGQPNTLLQIMQHEIDNDLQAQMNSKSNAQNLYKLNMQHEMQKAQIGQMANQNQLTQAEAKSVTADARAKAFALTQNQMLQSSFKQFANTVNGMPENTPQDLAKKQVAKQTLGMIYSKMGDKIVNINDQAAGASAYSSMLSNSNSASDPESAFQERQRMLRITGNDKIAQDNEAKHIPGVPGMASSPIPQEKRDQVLAMHTLDDKGKDLLHFIQQNTGTWDPKKRAIASQKIEEMKNFYNNSIQGGALTEGRLNWYDEQFKKNPTDRLAQFLGSTEKLKEMVNSNGRRKELLLNSLGLKAEPAQQEPQYKVVNGVKYMRGPDGKAVPVK